jgi:pre-mRNA 3'-end-processing factor FIP1
MTLMEDKDEFVVGEDQESSDIELVIDKKEKKAEEEQKSEDVAGAQSIFDYDIESMADKPWNKPGADITDYFNYGFNETTWREYCSMQRRRNESTSVHSDWNAGKYSGVRRGFYEMGRDEERKDRRRDGQKRAYDERWEGRGGMRRDEWHAAKHGYKDDKGEKRGRPYFAERDGGKRHWDGGAR